MKCSHCEKGCAANMCAVCLTEYGGLLEKNEALVAMIRRLIEEGDHYIDENLIDEARAMIKGLANET